MLVQQTVLSAFHLGTKLESTSVSLTVYLLASAMDSLSAYLSENKSEGKMVCWMDGLLAD